jgi:hypothetical protein
MKLCSFNLSSSLGVVTLEELRTRMARELNNLKQSTLRLTANDLFSRIRTSKWTAQQSAHTFLVRTIHATETKL